MDISEEAEKTMEEDRKKCTSENKQLTDIPYAKQKLTKHSVA